MNNWRPDNWPKLREKWVYKCQDQEALPLPTECLEDGADMMLKALRNNGFHFDKDVHVGITGVVVDKPPGMSGTIVVIPDDKKEEE